MNIVLETLWLLCRLLYYYAESFYRLFVWPPAKSIANEVALVTGAGRGIGREIAIALAKQGAHIAVCDINEAGCKETANIINETGGKAKAYRCDVTSIEDVADVASKIRRDLGDVDILVNNAGVVCIKNFLDRNEAEIRRTLDVNVLAQFWTVKEFLPSMIARKHGHIVVVASLAGRFSLALLNDYCTSKYAANGFAESLTDDLQRMKVTGVEVTIVYPSFVDTNMVFEVQDRYHSRNRVQARNLTPSEVADATVDGILHCQHHVYVPSYTSTVNVMSVMPFKAGMALKEFLRMGIHEVKND